MAQEGYLPAFFVPQEGHDQDVLPNLDWLRTGYTSGDQAFEVPHLFLCPEPDHLARVTTTVTSSEPIFARDIAVSIFEN